MKLCSIPYQGKRISAYAIGGRLNNGEGYGGSEGSVNGVPTMLQHGDSGLYREGLAGGDHATSGDCYATPRVVRVREEVHLRFQLISLRLSFGGYTQLYRERARAS